MLNVENAQGDVVRRRLEALASEMQERFGDAVEVHRSGGPLPATGGLFVEMTPPSDGPLAVWWFDDLDGLQLETGGGPGGRWELSRTEEGAGHLEDLVRSIVAGRAVEVLGPDDRSQMTVTLADGTKDSQTGYVGLAGLRPRPGWKRKGRRVEYEPWVG